MKNANGYGSVIKLPGNRRRPWACRKTIGWYDNGNPRYQFLSYHATRKEAVMALAKYNEDPYAAAKGITFAELYERFTAEHFPTVSESNIKGCRAAYKLFTGIYKMNVKDIRLVHLQGIVDASGKNEPTLKKAKILLGMMWNYAIKYEMISPDRINVIKNLDVSKAGNPNKIDRAPFNRDEIDLLWQSVESDPYYQLPLILIYSGLRIGEMYNLKREDVHLEEQWFFVRESKTDAGIREVPIADKVLPFWKHWMDKNTECVFTNKQGKRFTDRNFRDAYWSQMMDALNFKHLPHDTRHTCISMLTMEGANDTIIKKIVGHRGNTITEAVYTHIDLPAKLQAINLL